MPKLSKLREIYSHFEWSKDLNFDHWVVHTVNIYGKWAYVTFSSNETPSNLEQAESYLQSLEHFRIKGDVKYLGKSINLGKYVNRN